MRRGCFAVALLPVWLLLWLLCHGSVVSAQASQTYVTVPGYDLLVGSATTNSVRSSSRSMLRNCAAGALGLERAVLPVGPGSTHCHSRAHTRTGWWWWWWCSTRQIQRFNMSNGAFLSNYFVGAQNLLSGPTYMALHGNDLYVSCQTNNAIIKYPQALSTMIGARQSLFTFAKTPYGVAVHNETGNLYVVSHTQNVLYVVNSEDWQETNDIPVPHHQPTEILFSPLDGLLYVLSLSGTLTPFDITTNEFLPDVLNPIENYDTFPLCMCFNINGSLLFVATQQQTVIAYDAASGFTRLGLVVDWRIGGPLGGSGFIMGVRYAHSHSLGGHTGRQREEGRIGERDRGWILWNGGERVFCLGVVGPGQ